MKEHYDNLMDFISDIAKAAQQEINKVPKETCNTKCNNSCTESKNVLSNDPFFSDKECELKPMPGSIRVEDNGNHFIINEMVDGWPTAYEQHFYFNYVDSEGYLHPGITEFQLLSVLYDRYKNNPKKLDLIRQLMSL